MTGNSATREESPETIMTNHGLHLIVACAPLIRASTGFLDFEFWKWSHRPHPFPEYRTELVCRLWKVSVEPDYRMDSGPQDWLNFWWNWKRRTGGWTLISLCSIWFLLTPWTWKSKYSRLWWTKALCLRNGFGNCPEWIHSSATCFFFTFSRW